MKIKDDVHGRWWHEDSVVALGRGLLAFGLVAGASIAVLVLLAVQRAT